MEINGATDWPIMGAAGEDVDYYEDEYFEDKEGLTPSSSFDILLEAYANSMMSKGNVSVSSRRGEVRKSGKGRKRRGFRTRRAAYARPGTYHRLLNQISPLYLGKASVALEDGFESNTSPVNVSRNESFEFVMDSQGTVQRISPYPQQSRLSKGKQKQRRRGGGRNRDKKKLNNGTANADYGSPGVYEYVVDFSNNGSSQILEKSGRYIQVEGESGISRSLTEDEMLSSDYSEEEEQGMAGGVGASTSEKRLDFATFEIIGDESFNARAAPGYDDDDEQNNVENASKQESDEEDWNTEKIDNPSISEDNKENRQMNERLVQRYQPRSFEEIIGQSVLTQTLAAYVKKDDVASFYLFYGPRGTGKTCAARIFGMALNCEASCDEEKPCWKCESCTKKSDLEEVDATRHYVASDSVKVLVQTIKYCYSASKYKVYIIDECQFLSAEAWTILFNGIEECSAKAVIIMITTGLSGLPDIALSRCQQFCFSKISDSDINKRLTEIALAEAIDIDDQALRLIGRKVSGSMRAALNYLEQLRVSGARVTEITVRQLVGVVPDEELINLLGLVMSSDPTNTVRYIRSITESGIEPMVLVNQLAKLITDIIAGSHSSSVWMEAQENLARQDYSSEDLSNRLCVALKILSEAEKQLRSSNDDLTWLTAALLQLSPNASSYSDPGLHSRTTQNTKLLHDGGNRDKYRLKYHVSPDRRHAMQVQLLVPEVASIGTGNSYGEHDLKIIPIQRSNEIWKRVLNRIRADGVKKMLETRGKLVKAFVYRDRVVINLVFGSQQDREMVEMIKGSLSDAFHEVLAHPVELNMGIESTSHHQISHIVQNSKSKQKQPAIGRRLLPATGPAKSNRRPLGVLRSRSSSDDSRTAKILRQRSTSSTSSSGSPDNLAVHQHSNYPEQQSKGQRIMEANRSRKRIIVGRLQSSSSFSEGRSARSRKAIILDRLHSSSFREGRARITLPKATEYIPVGYPQDPSIFQETNMDSKELRKYKQADIDAESKSKRSASYKMHFKEETPPSVHMLGSNVDKESISRRPLILSKNPSSRIAAPASTESTELEQDTPTLLSKPPIFPRRKDIKLTKQLSRMASLCCDNDPEQTQQTKLKKSAEKGKLLLQEPPKAPKKAKSRSTSKHSKANLLLKFTICKGTEIADQTKSRQRKSTQ